MAESQEMELRKFVAPEIITGEGSRLLISRYLSHFGTRRPMIVTDPQVAQQTWFDEIVDAVKAVVEDVIIYQNVTPNPKDYEAMKGAEIFLRQECDIIIAIGGGSPMDCAKCISIVSANAGNILDYEGVDMVQLPGPPLICIPSTSGTAADVSQFAIINDTQLAIKKAIISKKVVPDLALIDPVPLLTMDTYLTACTGMDVLTHAIEAYVSNASSTLTDMMALEGIRLVNQHLYDAVQPERDLLTMYKMMIASTDAGLAFSNASLGAVHAMAHSMGGLLDLPHGECNSILLEHVIAVNFDAAAQRYRNIGMAMGADCGCDDDQCACDALLQRITQLRESIGIPGNVNVDEYSPEIRDRLVDAALADPCMVTNPKELTREQVGGIFDRIIQKA